MNITREMKMRIFGAYLDGMCLDEIAAQMKIDEGEVYDALNIHLHKQDKLNHYAFPNIVRWLIGHGCSQKELAERIDIHYTQLNGYLCGRRVPSIDNIDKILRVTGMTYEEAFGDPRKEHD